jgi:LysR family transcriptional regulator, glycine cleavage system transcriptional activator
MLPDLESLRCFVQAATLPSFRAAARSVALSPTAFGERIRRLEDTLGARLFQRTTRSVRLTAAGARLLPQAERVLHEATRCSELTAVGTPAPFDLVLGTRFELGMSFIVPALGALERKHPTRHLHLSFGDTADLLRRIVAGELDGMVTSARLTAPSLETARLHPEAYAFVAAEALAAERPLAKAADARRHVLLDVSPDLPLFRYLLDARSADEAWSFARVQYLGGIAAIRARALEGAGVAVLPLYYVREDLRRGRLRRLLPATRLPSDWFRLVWKKGHLRADELRTLAAELSRLPLR